MMNLDLMIEMQSSNGNRNEVMGKKRDSGEQMQCGTSHPVLKTLLYTAMSPRFSRYRHRIKDPSPRITPLQTRKVT